MLVWFHKLLLIEVHLYLYLYVFLYSRVAQRGGGLASAARSEHEVSEIIDGISEQEVGAQLKITLLPALLFSAISTAPSTKHIVVVSLQLYNFEEIKHTVLRINVCMHSKQ